MAERCVICDGLVMSGRCVVCGAEMLKTHAELMHELALLSMDPDSTLDRDSDVDIWGFDLADAIRSGSEMSADGVSLPAGEDH